MEEVKEEKQLEIFAQELREKIEQKNTEWIKVEIEAFDPVEISTVLEHLDLESIQFVIFLLPEQSATKILSNMDLELQRDILENESPSKIAQYLAFFESDDAADLLNIFQRKTRDEALAEIEDLQHAMGIEELLRYDDDSAGGLMAKELVKVKLDWTVSQCIAEIQRLSTKVKRLLNIYVVNANNELQGVLSSRELLIVEPDTRIKDIYIEDVKFVETFIEDSEVADIMQKYDLTTIAVVNSRKQLLGRITIDDIVDVIQDNADESIQIMSGLSEDVEHSDSVFRLVRARLPWLVIGVIGGLLGAFFLEGWGDGLDLRLTFFIPLIMATGGNVGIQSSSITIQGLSGDKRLWGGHFTKGLLKLVAVALINGSILAGCVYAGIAFFMLPDYQLALVVSTSMVVVVLVSSILGTVTPLVLHSLKINPALASGPFITTTNDVIGLLVFLWLGSYLMVG